MKITKKQNQEVDFLIKYFNGDEKDTEQYLNWTVNGKNKGDSKFDDNKLFQAKRKLDIMVKLWTEDMQKGQLAYWELLEDFGYCEYVKRLVKSIRKGIHPLPSYGGNLGCASLGYLNSKYTVDNSTCIK